MNKLIFLALILSFTFITRPAQSQASKLTNNISDFCKNYPGMAASLFYEKLEMAPKSTDDIIISIIDSPLEEYAGCTLARSEYLKKEYDTKYPFYLWTKTSEIPGDGIDNDGNGFIDDVHGFNFSSNTGDISKNNLVHSLSVFGFMLGVLPSPNFSLGTDMISTKKKYKNSMGTNSC